MYICCACVFSMPTSPFTDMSQHIILCVCVCVCVCACACTRARVCSVGAVLCVIMYVEVSGSTLCMHTCVPSMWKMVVVLVHVCACMGQANAIKKKEKQTKCQEEKR